MGVHHHAYTWIGSGSDYGTDSARRPNGTGFDSTAIVPLEPANWLLKSRRLIKGTFEETEPALEWFTAQVQAYVDRFDGEHAKDPETLRFKLEQARETMTLERDVIAGWWMNGGSSFYAVHLVACPNFFRPEHPCPEGLQ